MGLRKGDVPALIAAVYIGTGLASIVMIDYVKERRYVREAETSLKQSRSMVACVKGHGRDSCNGALLNLLGRETNIGACRDAQRAVEALTSDSPARLDDAVKACRG
jgi:hypothetical protein